MLILNNDNVTNEFHITDIVNGITSRNQGSLYHTDYYPLADIFSKN